MTEAERIICPSADAASHVDPFIADPSLLTVVPHDSLEHRTFPEPAPPPLGLGERMRVALLGVLSGDKGAAVVSRCMRSLAGSPGAPEFTLLGFVPDEHVGLMAGVDLHSSGLYDPDELPGLIRRARPHVVWFPSASPETYSYTLSEAMAERLPVLVSDVGALPERVSGRQWSWVVPWDLSPEEGVAVFQEVADQLREGVWKGPELVPRSGPWVRGPSSYPVQSRFYDDEYLGPLTPRSDHEPGS